MYRHWIIHLCIEFNKFEYTDLGNWYLKSGFQLANNRFCALRAWRLMYCNVVLARTFLRIWVSFVLSVLTAAFKRACVRLYMVASSWNWCPISRRRRSFDVTGIGNSVNRKATTTPMTVTKMRKGANLYIGRNACPVCSSVVIPIFATCEFQSIVLI